MDRPYSEYGNANGSPPIVDPSNATPPPKEASGKALASFICAILAVCLCLLGITAVAGIPLAMIALIFGLISRREAFGKAGVVLALFALLIPLIYAASYIVPHLVDPAL